MKKLLFFIITVAAALSLNAAPLSTNVTAGGVHLLTTNNSLYVYSVEIVSDKVVTVELFDNESVTAPVWGTNYVTGAYVSRSSYPTNYVTTYIGQNNFTNTFTNVGLWTISVTNAAATNALPASGSFVVGVSGVSVYATDILFTRGIVMRTSTNANVVLNYRVAN